MKRTKLNWIVGAVAVVGLLAGQAAFAQGVLFVTGGNVGISNSSPSQPLQLSKSNGTAQALIEDTVASAKSMMVLKKPGLVKFELQNTNNPNPWVFTANNSNNFTISLLGTGGSEVSVNPAGNMTLRGTLVTGGAGTCNPGPCDGVFDPDVYQVESIEEHAEYMWTNRHLWGVGPTPEGAPLNLSKKTTGILHELEKAHIYIEQLHDRVKALEARLETSGR